MAVKQYGSDRSDEVELHSYAEAAHLDKLRINAGDFQGTLAGTRLDQVAAVELSGVHFAPAELTRVDTKDELRLTTDVNHVSSLHAGDKVTARASLKDGRTLNLEATIEEPRPKLLCFNKSIQPGPSVSEIQLGNQDELPQDGKLVFFLKSEIPDTFSRTQKIEVGTADGAYDVSLSLNDGSLLAQDAHTVVATLDPLKSFGPAAFGPLRFRVSTATPTGDWAAARNVGAIPGITGGALSYEPDKQCVLSGTNLFLISFRRIGSGIKHSVPVPGRFLSTLN